MSRAVSLAFIVVHHSAALSGQDEGRAGIDVTSKPAGTNVVVAVLHDDGGAGEVVAGLSVARS